MKVLILANDAGGLYSFRRELLETLLERGHEVHFTVPDGPRAELIRQMGCLYHCVQIERRGKNPFKDLQLMLSYRKLLRQVQPDIVFTYTIKPNVYGGMACTLEGVPYVANITGLGSAVENGGWMQKLSLMLYRLGLAKAQKVFFQNTENQHFMLSRGVVKGAYDLLPGSGVNLQRYQVLPYPDGETVDFVFIARIMKEKGIDQYLDAARYIRRKYPQTRFHICGACEEGYEQLLQQLHEDGTVIYHGMVSDIAAVHQVSQCTIHPTYYPEGLSNVLLESAACGRPIITTDRSGCREVIDNGINGFVIRQKDAEDLIEKVERFLALSSEERKAMGLAGRAKVEKEFDRQIVIGKYLAEMGE